MSTSGQVTIPSRRASLQYSGLQDAANQPTANVQDMDESCPVTKLPEDAILVMGLTGSGKSTFISLLADEAIQVGHDLSSCTTEARGHAATIDGRSTLLLDTPGFDDTDRSDFEIVNEIAMGLHTLYKMQLNIRGVIYIQRITDTRMSGSSRRSLEILDAICGINAFANITFVTTMWDKLGPDSATLGTERTEEMKKLFLAEFIKGGARIVEHGGTAESAQGIIRKILSCNQPVILEIQRETEMQNLTLEQTAVGKILQHDLQRQQKEHDAELKEMEQQLQEAQQSNDRRAIEMLMEEVVRQKEQIQRLRESSSHLHLGVQQLGEIKSAGIERQLEEAQKLDLELTQDNNDDIRARIYRTNQRTRSLQNDQHWQAQKFYEENARLQNANDRRNGERLTAQRARRHAARGMERRDAARGTMTIWELWVRQVYVVQQRPRRRGSQFSSSGY